MTSTSTPPDADPGPARRSPVARRRWPTAVAFLLPAAILYGYFVVWPMFDTVRLSLYSWDGFAASPQRWVGLDNYRRLVTTDAVFWIALRNTMIWVVLSLAIPMALSLALALALNRHMRGRNVFRSVFYLPAVFASISVAAMWKWIYDPVLGAADQLMRAVGLGRWSPEWLGDPTIALYSIFAASVWQGVGFGMVLFLAGLQQIPEELMAAARLDGAGRWTTFWAVMAPALRPTTVAVVVLTSINSLKVFDLVVGLTGGGPAQSTQVLALWGYTQSFSNNDFGAGGAVTTVLLVVSLLLVVPYLLWTLRRERAR
ncbi:carbohydrate ABC transporter permease [Williamsia sp. CHRR-6]|uniref:carbohydrate ABC transporter permease n=1 Tax=Williamsia sp. CHRR-6 TaxID=2835871 RepID=UPI001BD94562|nr:sugar ABC transporter permease [Williamsia sp. CHRR-6]MBT0566627.1 sugar ABC transporter permease [Williamsia sp. CHRR-6]